MGHACDTGAPMTPLLLPESTLPLPVEVWSTSIIWRGVTLDLLYTAVAPAVNAS